MSDQRSTGSVANECRATGASNVNTVDTQTETVFTRNMTTTNQRGGQRGRGVPRLTTAERDFRRGMRAPVVEVPVEDYCGIASKRWTNPVGLRLFLVNPIPPPLPAWRRALDGTETCVFCGCSNEDDILRPIACSDDRLGCPSCYAAGRRMRRRRSRAAS